MWSTAAVFYSGAMNPPTCLLYLHGMSGPERLKPSETSLIVSHSFRWTSDRRGRGGGVNGTGEYVCVCVCLSMCELSNTNIHTCTFTLSAAQMCIDTQNEHVTHTSLHYTPPSPALCFVMIFIPHRWLMTVLSWAFVVNAACLSHKPNQTKTFCGYWTIKNPEKYGDILQSYLEVIYFHNTCGKWVLN